MDWGAVSYWLPKALPVLGIIAVFVLVYAGADRIKSAETFQGKLGGLLMMGSGLFIGFLIIALTTI